MDRIWQHMEALEADGTAYVLATVIRTLAPTSAQLGARALVTGDGHVIGYVGGDCTKRVLTDAARETLRIGHAQILRIAPDVKPDAPHPPEVMVRAMTCQSGGQIDLLLEPYRPDPPLVVVGDSPTAVRLAEIASHLSWRVTRLSYDASGDWSEFKDELIRAVMPGAYVVAATMGQYDDWLIETLRSVPLTYFGLVASQRRGAMLKELWTAAPSPEGRFSSPAGKGIKSRDPELIALSILMEMAEIRQNVPMAESPALLSDAVPRWIQDPVCHMQIDLNQTPYRWEWQGTTWGFCTRGCLQAFKAKPEAYALVEGGFS